MQAVYTKDHTHDEDTNYISSNFVLKSFLTRRRGTVMLSTNTFPTKRRGPVKPSCMNFVQETKNCIQHTSYTHILQFPTKRRGAPTPSTEPFPTKRRGPVDPSCMNFMQETSRVISHPYYVLCSKCNARKSFCTTSVIILYANSEA